MRNFDLNQIDVPNELSTVVEHSIVKARKSEQKWRTARKYSTMAAAIVILLGTGVLAARQLFPTHWNSGKQDPSRVIALNNGFYESVSGIESESGGVKISLENYYVDSNEAGFEYVITGVDLDDFTDYSYVENRTYEMVYENESLIWKHDIENGNSYTNSPNGMILTGNTSVTKVGDRTYRLVDIVTLYSPVAVGNKINISYDGLVFGKQGDISKEYADKRKTVSGNWDFSINVHNKFKKIDEIKYELADASEAAQHGIELVSMVSTPLDTKLILAVDFTKNKIADPQNIQKASEPKYAQKLNVMDMHGALKITAGGENYNVKTSYPEGDVSGIVSCVFDVDSFYYKNPQSINVAITEQDGNVITLQFNKISK